MDDGDIRVQYLYRPGSMARFRFVCVDGLYPLVCYNVLLCTLAAVEVVDWSGFDNHYSTVPVALFALNQPAIFLTVESLYTRNV